MLPTIRQIGLGLFVVLCPTLATADEQPRDHIGAYNFLLEIAGVNAGYFKGVDGLNAQVEVVQHAQGDYVFLRKQATNAAFGNITLKRGYTSTRLVQVVEDAARASSHRNPVARAASHA